MYIILHLIPFCITGKDASIGQLMDFIFASRMAKKYEKLARVSVSGDEDSNEVFDDFFMLFLNIWVAEYDKRKALFKVSFAFAHSCGKVTYLTCKNL